MSKGYFAKQKTRFLQFCREVLAKIKLLLGLIGLLYVIQLINWSFGMPLNQFGIMPRNIELSWHIFTAPFIHGSWQHLINNSLGLLVFGGFALLQSRRFFLWACFLILLMTGVLVWGFARPAVHIGASGVIFGLWALMITNAFMHASFKNILVSLLVMFLYGGMIYGVLPGKEGVSFESHLFGALSGVMVAWLLHKLKLD